MLDAALRYARSGWPVFPCKPGSKEPDTRHGFKDAITSPDVIRGWWAERPYRNVAIATGEPGPDVLDVDNHGPGRSGFAAYNQVKRAGLLGGGRAIVRTPSGGFHVYYAGTGQPCGRIPRCHLDCKAAGGYVLAPPSVVEGRVYELLEHRPAIGRLRWQAIRDLLDPPRPGAPARPRTGDVSRLAAWVASQPEGNRNAGLYWAACRNFEERPDQDARGLVTAAMTAGLSEAEALRTVCSAGRAAG
jgi:hypothetical protein